MHAGELICNSGLVFLGLALLVAFSFEFINGFHDTANAVATVIYTRSLKPTQAVVLSGFFNFLGVQLGGMAVAFTIVRLLPVDVLTDIRSPAGLATVLSLLLAATLWNFATWSKGLPASSSHTLIGAIVGVGLVNSFLAGRPMGGAAVWRHVEAVFLSLLTSPLIGFALAALLLLLLKRIVRAPRFYRSPSGSEAPPRPLRALLITTSACVSFAHGSNDGQKGIGLVMLILIGSLPGRFAVNTHLGARQIQQTYRAAGELQATLDRRAFPAFASAGPIAAGSVTGGNSEVACVHQRLERVRHALAGRESLGELTTEERWQLRSDILKADEEMTALNAGGHLRLTAGELAAMKQSRKLLCRMTEYAPAWVVLAVALALGIGTTVGWKRIVITVGERIGKTHLAYAQGASAELVAAVTIGLGNMMGLPVSTTHVLSSGVAGTMFANRSGIQGKTVRDIALAWVATFPAACILSASLFMLFRCFVP